MKIVRAAIAAAGIGIIAGLVIYQAVRRQHAAPSPPTTPLLTAATPSPTAVPSHAFFDKYCIDCHSGPSPDGGLHLDTLLHDPHSIGTQSTAWERVARMIENRTMPKEGAAAQPTDDERQTAVHSVRTTLAKYEEEHAGEPGKITLRRLTSAEYAYAIEDLTGLRIRLPIDATSDSVGGEGFSNFGDVQFIQEANTERYLEAAKLVADHAVIGSGPLAFYSDPGRTGLELSALARINELYESKGFRVVSGEGGRPYGLERYASALFVAWYYQHRVALGDPDATLRDLAAKEGITGRFAEHIWSVLNNPNLGFPTSAMVAEYKTLPPPTGNVAESIAKGRTNAKALQEYMTTWPSWFFARGDLAAGGAGDESPLAFNDETLAVTAKHAYAYPLGQRPARGRADPTPVGRRVYISFINMNRTPGVKPVVIFRNARIATFAPTATTRAGRGGAEGAAAANDQQEPTAAAGGGNANARGRATRTPASTIPLRSALPPEAAAELKFGTSPDATPLGPDDFAISGPISFDLPPTPGASMELQMDAELGADRNGVVRLMISDRPEGSSQDKNQRIILAEPGSEGHKTFRAGMAEYASLLPPNSHGEANPADKDPVPAPFDNTYNSPEHDAFVLKIKYQRIDQFFTDNLVDGTDRARLHTAWNDLLGSWPYHDAYLRLLADHYGIESANLAIADMTPARIATLPTEMRGYVTSLRGHHEQVSQAFKDAQPGQISDTIEFAARAWRRPLADAEKAALRSFYDTCRTTHSLDHEAALRALIARVLVAPEFLYRVETVAAETEKPLNNWELASRLSFFLWASIPDDELRRAATAGELDKPDLLAQQVKRMIADPKSRRISMEFFGQWLGFYRFDEYRGVDTARFPEFTDAVRNAMYDEAVSTYDYLVRENRPIKEILDADYTFLNQPLAQYYGLAGKVAVDSQAAVVKVDGAKAFDRGGALRLGSVLTITSAPLRTSPVKRGDWILRRILGTPTPTPPADAGTLPGDPAAFGGLTLRERLTQHKRNPTCASCHLEIDPLGFPLEGFDAVGRARTTYPDGKPVDVSGEFTDGKSVRGAGDLITYLGEKDAIFMRNFSRKMLGYALGRTVGAADQRLVNEMIAAGNTATFAQLATQIVTSRQFRNHEGRGTEPGKTASTPAFHPQVAARESSQPGAAQ